MARTRPRRGSACGAGAADVAGSVRARVAGRYRRGLLVAGGFRRARLRPQPGGRPRGRDRVRPVERRAPLAAGLPGALCPERHRSGWHAGSVRDAGGRRWARIHAGRGRHPLELGRGVGRAALAERLLRVGAGDRPVLRHIGLAARRRWDADRPGRQRRRRRPRAGAGSGDRRGGMGLARRRPRIRIADRGRDRGAAPSGYADRVVGRRARRGARRTALERAVHRRMAREHRDTRLDRRALGGLRSPPGDARVRDPSRRTTAGRPLLPGATGGSRCT